jgi:hypothetical protein
MRFSGSTVQFAITGQPFGPSSQSEIVLPEWDDSISRQVIELQSEVKRLEQRIAELESINTTTQISPPSEAAGPATKPSDPSDADESQQPSDSPTK